MRDIDIRNILRHIFQQKYDGDSDTFVIEEMGLCQGDARIDVAVVNGSIHGYEIKSEKDTLKRLSGQQVIYSKVLDYVTVVACSRHLSKVEKSVPHWWGLNEVIHKNGKIQIVKIRPHQENTGIDPNALVQLLWRDEAIDILRKRNMHKGVLSKPRKLAWKRLINVLTIDELRTEVRETIKRRQFLRFAQIPKLDDALYLYAPIL